MLKVIFPEVSLVSRFRSLKHNISKRRTYTLSVKARGVSYTLELKNNYFFKT